MGVNLRELIPTKEIEFENLAGKTIALDTFNIMFQFLSTVRDRFTGEPLRDSKGRVTSHLSGLFYRGNKMLEVGVTPVFVFDGKAPDFKASVQEERAKIRKEAEVKWRKAVEDGDL
ncbi:MAG: flap structure-specific endonuclease, partial [Candidatus Aenigmatarchaeota archaeon]